MKPYLAKCLYDLVVLSNPAESSHEDVVAGESQLEAFASAHLIDFVHAYYQRLLHLRKAAEDTRGILVLQKRPWVVPGGSGGLSQIQIDNIKASGQVLNTGENDMKKRILNALETNDAVMSPLRRSSGPGLSIVIWRATCKPDLTGGEFLSELELDCRGKIDLLLTTRRAVVMGAEIKTSASDIPRAKKQLIRRFKVIATCLAATHRIAPEDSICVGRVFYRNVPEGSVVAHSEDESGEGLTTLSFYYHRV
jgi:hypothetical protein